MEIEENGVMENFKTRRQSLPKFPGMTPMSTGKIKTGVFSPDNLESVKIPCRVNSGR